MTVKFTNMCDGQKQEFPPRQQNLQSDGPYKNLSRGWKEVFRTLRPFSLSEGKSLWENFTVVLGFSHMSTCLFVFRYCDDHTAS